MKKFLIVIISLILSLAICLSGCTTITQGTSNSSGGGNSSGGSSSSGSSSEAEGYDTAYTVTLVLPEGVTTMPDLTGIKAKWTNSTSVYTADFSASGFAYYEGLDGEYTVTISGMIDGYSYNPNIYDTSSGKDVSIQLITLQSFSGQDGSSAKNEGLALAYDTGVYRIEFSDNNVKFFFMFLPNLTTTGYTYSIQTYADTTENEICPTFYLYFYSTRNLRSTITGGSSYNGSYTKNVYYELDMSSYTPSSSYNSFIYVFSITSTNSDFPKYMDICLTREKEYSDDDYWESVGGKYTYAETDETQIVSYSAPTGTQTWITDLYTDFSYIETKKGSDGYYYIVYNGNEYLLYAELSDCHLSSAYGETVYNFADGYTGSFCSILKTYYYNVIQAYLTNSQSCNSYGIHPVTEQLHEFLYYYSAQKLFNDSDGTSSTAGLMEQIGYTSNDANQWLYACCFYV